MRFRRWRNRKANEKQGFSLAQARYELWEGSTKRRKSAAVMAALIVIFSGTVLFSQAAPKAQASTPAASDAPGQGGGLGADESSLAFAPEGGAKAGTVKAKTPGISSFVQMLGVLGLVALSVYGAVMFFIKLKKPRTPAHSSIQVLASSSLAPGKAIHVVKAGDRAYLIGSSESAVSLIANVEDKEYVDRLELEAQAAPQRSGKPFAQLLGALMGRGGQAPGPSGDQFAFMKRQREKLKKYQ
jgi:flagellar protein FliO/FliZ